MLVPSSFMSIASSLVIISIAILARSAPGGRVVQPRWQVHAAGQAGQVGQAGSLEGQRGRWQPPGVETLGAERRWGSAVRSARHVAAEFWQCDVCDCVGLR